MKYLLPLAPICALLLSTACSQSPERLLAAGNKYHQNKKYTEASILYRKAIAKDKTNAEAYYREGLNLLDQNNPVEASKFLRRAVDLKPDNADAETKLAEIYLTAYSTNPKRLKGLLPDVRDLANKVLQREPHSFDGIRLRALVSLADGDNAKALESFAEANRIQPNSRQIVGWYARTLSINGHKAEAHQLIRNMIAHDKTWGASYDFLYLEAVEASDTSAAEAALRERVHNDPKNAVAIVNLANYLSSRNHVDEAQTIIRRVLDDQASFPLGHEIVGDFYFRTKKYDEALSEYRAGLKDNSKHELQYQQRIVSVLTGSGHRAEALKLAQDLAAKNPKDAMTTQMYASLLLDSGVDADANKSVEELKKLVQKNGADPVLHLDLARAYFGLNQMDKAMAEAVEASHQRPNLMPARVIQARIYEDRGQHAKALEQTDVVINAEPKNPDARLVRDRALIGINEADKAQPELEELVASYPNMHDARLELANLYSTQKEYGKAYDAFQKVWTGTPPDVRGFLGMQSVKVQQGKGDAAVSALKELAEKNPKDVRVLYALANFQGTYGEQVLSSDPAQAKQLFRQSADNYQKILKGLANSSDVWLRLGVMQRHLDQNDAALASFAQAASAAPSKPEAFLNRAMLLEAMGKTDQARDAYNKVLGIDSENTIALNNLAFLTADNGGNLDQAMTMAERAKKRLPNNSTIADTLGFVYYKKDLNAEAVRIFKQVVEEEPKNATFRLHLAMALLKTGDRAGARREAQSALTVSSGQDEQSKIKSFMGQIG